MAIEYSDGDVELKIKAIIEQNAPVSSAGRFKQEQSHNWYHRYHLSPVRSNLMRHFDFSGLDVLELGAGMGAVSRYLAEHSQWLTAVEGSQRRFSVLASRLRDLHNWDGVVANVEELSLARKYDVVCIVGVMEYSELYTTKPAGEPLSPAAWFLRQAASHLKDDGVLVIAIENKLGLKYWRGAAEDHLGTVYSGLSDYPMAPTARTYSRKELLDLLAGAGLPIVSEYYPYPDYKLAHTVLTNEFASRWPELSMDITTSEYYAGSDYPNTQIFPEALVGRSVARAGLLPDMANSFLFAACSSTDSPTLIKLKGKQITSSERAWHYSTERTDPVRTVFSVSDSRQLRVHKESLVDGSRPPDKTLIGGDEFIVHWHALNELVIENAEPLRTILSSHAYFKRWDAWWDEMLAFFRWTMSRWAVPDDSSNPNSPSISGNALDAGIFNALVPNKYARLSPSDMSDRYLAFDLEYTTPNSIPMTWFIFRSIFVYDQVRSPLLQTIPLATLHDTYVRCCTDLGLTPEYNQDRDREAKFFAVVHGLPVEQGIQIIDASMYGPQVDEPPPQGAWDVLDLHNGYVANPRQMVALELELNERNRILASRTHRIAAAVCQVLIKTRRILKPNKANDDSGEPT